MFMQYRAHKGCGASGFRNPPCYNNLQQGAAFPGAAPAVPQGQVCPTSVPHTARKRRRAGRLRRPAPRCERVPSTGVSSR